MSGAGGDGTGLSFYPIGSFVELNTKEIGRVVRINAKFPLLPVIEILTDSKKNTLKETRQADLSKEPLLFVRDALGAEEAVALLEGKPNATD